jgi:hypothetical protein
MRLYKHRQYSDVIELVGVGHHEHDLLFRYPGWEFKDAQFSIARSELKKHYVKLKTIHWFDKHDGTQSKVASRSTTYGGLA